MKTTTVLLTLLFLFNTLVLSAHPASSVIAEYDEESQLLTISFKHQVRDNADHYISEVVVLRNKKEVVRQKLTLQDSKEGGALIYKLNDVKEKDKLDINTTCNKTGRKSFTLVIK